MSTETSHLPEYTLYIKKIIQASIVQRSDSPGRTIVAIEFPWGRLYCRFSKKDGVWIDSCDYSIQSRLSKPMLWTLSTPKNVFMKFLEYGLSFELLQAACKSQGQKLTKPNELRGVKAVCSVPCDKLRSQAYVLGDDIYVYHNEYFCPEMPIDPNDRGTPLSYRANKYLGKTHREEFIYPDTWGSIMLQNIAWCKFSGYMRLFHFLLPVEIAELMRDMTFSYHGFCYSNGGVALDWLRFYEKICSQIAEKQKLKCER